MKVNFPLATLLLGGFYLLTTLPAGAAVNWQPIPGTKSPDESGSIVNSWYSNRQGG